MKSIDEYFEEHKIEYSNKKNKVGEKKKKKFFLRTTIRNQWSL